MENIKNILELLDHELWMRQKTIEMYRAKEEEHEREIAKRDAIIAEYKSREDAIKAKERAIFFEGK